MAITRKNNKLHHKTNKHLTLKNKHGGNNKLEAPILKTIKQLKQNNDKITVKNISNLLIVHKNITKNE